MHADHTIPRRIIQTGKSRDLPPLAQAAARTMQLLHPEWEYLFFDDAAVLRFVSTEFPQYQNVFDSFPHRIQRFDFFRYLVVYRFGGFYFDLDVFLYNELTELLSYQCVFPFEELSLNSFLRDECAMDWEVGNYAFGAAPASVFIGSVIENCVRAQRDREWASHLLRGIPLLFRSRFEVLNTTGPGLVTRTFVEQSSGYGKVKILFPDDACDSRQWHRFGKFGVHLMEASWRDRGNFFERKAALIWENWRRNRQLTQSRVIGQTRAIASEKLA